MYSALDCQGFAGGFTLGVVQAGFKLVGKREMKGGFGVPNCLANRHLLGYDWDVEATSPQSWSIRQADMVFGNPPCSGWSPMSASSFRGGSSPALSCTWAFVEYAARVNPQVVIFESVQQAFTHKDGLPTMRALWQRLKDLTGDDSWTLVHVLHNAYSLGGAAHRKRYFWLATRVPFGIEFHGCSQLPVLNDVIGDLADLPEAWETQPYSVGTEPHPWAAARRSEIGVDGHVSVRNPLTGRVVDLLKEVEWKPGEYLSLVTRRYYDKMGHLPSSWSATEKKVVANDFFMGYTTPIRWCGDEPARVITGGSLFTTVHPWLPRTITHREAARILGFPDDWNLAALRTTPGLAATHGKGITVDCGRWIAQWIKASLDGEPGTHTGLKIAEKEYVIDVTNGYKTSQNLIQLSLQEPTPLVKRVLKSLLPMKGKIMTDPTAPEVPQVEGEVATETTEATVKSGHKGRPRSQETLERDEKAFEALAEPKTREELAAVMGVEPSIAYLSIWRLNKAGRIHKVREDKTYKWSQGAPVAASESTEVSDVTAPETSEDVPAVPAI